MTPQMWQQVVIFNIKSEQNFLSFTSKMRFYMTLLIAMAVVKGAPVMKPSDNEDSTASLPEENPADTVPDYQDVILETDTDTPNSSSHVPLIRKRSGKNGTSWKGRPRRRW